MTTSCGGFGSPGRATTFLVAPLYFTRIVHRLFEDTIEHIRHGRAGLPFDLMAAQAAVEDD